MATFGLNCLLHVAWWGQVSAGTWAWEYRWVLLVAPALGLPLDNHALIPLFQLSKKYEQDDTCPMQTVGWSQRRLLYHGTSLVALQAMAAWLMPLFLKAQDRPSCKQDAFPSRFGWTENQSYLVPTPIIGQDWFKASCASDGKQCTRRRQDECGSLWFHCFVQGLCKRRMGQD